MRMQYLQSKLIDQMLGTKTFPVKPLSDKSVYFKEYTESKCKGDKAVEVFGKSENDGIVDFWWDSARKDYLPWRGGTVITNRGTFNFCVYFKWWSNQPKQPDRLFNRLTNGCTIEEESPTIYFWKDSAKQSEKPTYIGPSRKTKGPKQFKKKKVEQ